MKYVILLQSSDHKAQIIGSEKGNGLNREDAEKLGKAYTQSYPRLDVLVMPISPLGADTAPLSRRSEVAK